MQYCNHAFEDILDVRPQNGPFAITEEQLQSKLSHEHSD